MMNPTDIDRYFNVFFDYVRQLVDIPPSDQALCRKNFKAIKIKKDTLLEREGQIPRYHNFIVSGYMRNYFIDAEGKEVVTDLNDGPRFFTSYNHYLNQTPSSEYLHCVTDCELLRISKEDADREEKTSETQLAYTVLILQNGMERRKQQNIDFSTLSAEERYLKLMKNHPSILQNFPLKYVASYLGMNAGSLSRIRSMSRSGILK